MNLLETVFFITWEINQTQKRLIVQLDVMFCTIWMWSPVFSPFLYWMHVAFSAPSSLFSKYHHPFLKFSPPTSPLCLLPSFFASCSPPVLPPLQSCCRVVCCQYVGAPQHHSSPLILHAKPWAESDSSFHPGPNHIVAHNNLKPCRPLTLTLISQPPLSFVRLGVFPQESSARGRDFFESLTFLFPKVISLSFLGCFFLF